MLAEFVEGVLRSVWGRAVLPGRSGGTVAGESGAVRSFNGVGAELAGAVEGVELLLEWPVLTAVREALDFVCVPADVEDPDCELVGVPDE